MRLQLVSSLEDFASINRDETHIVLLEPTPAITRGDLDETIESYSSTVTIICPVNQAHFVGSARLEACGCWIPKLDCLPLELLNQQGQKEKVFFAFPKVPARPRTQDVLEFFVQRIMASLLSTARDTQQRIVVFHLDEHSIDLAEAIEILDNFTQQAGLNTTYLAIGTSFPKSVSPSETVRIWEPNRQLTL